MDSLVFSISRPPPEFVYSGEEFSFEYIVNEHCMIDALLESSTTGDCGTAVLGAVSDTIINGQEATRPGIETHVFIGRIRMDQIPLAGASFRIRLVSTDGRISILTSGISLVLAKLKMEHIEWEIPFYNAQGGRNKGQLVILGAYDCNDRLLPQPVDFYPTICYRDDVENRNLSNYPCDQGELIILQNSGEKKHRMKASSKRTCKFRYKSISKNHWKFCFVVKFSVLGRGDIAPVDTEAVEVRSKQPKPPPKRKNTDDPHALPEKKKQNCGDVVPPLPKISRQQDPSMLHGNESKFCTDILMPPIRNHPDITRDVLRTLSFADSMDDSGHGHAQTEPSCSSQTLISNNNEESQLGYPACTADGYSHDHHSAPSTADVERSRSPSTRLVRIARLPRMLSEAEILCASQFLSDRSNRVPGMLHQRNAPRFDAQQAM